MSPRVLHANHRETVDASDARADRKSDAGRTAVPPSCLLIHLNSDAAGFLFATNIHYMSPLLLPNIDWRLSDGPFRAIDRLDAL